jgi:hypothetical protein
MRIGIRARRQEFCGAGLTGELFRTASGVAFADVAVKGRRETWPIRSNVFRGWLRHCHLRPVQPLHAAPLSCWQHSDAVARIRWC